MPIYSIAGLRVKMSPLFERVQSNAAPYLIDGEGFDIDLTVPLDEIKYVADLNGTDDLQLCEYMLLGQRFYKHLVSFDGLMVHASAVVLDGKAYLFSADPGTGKSTHVRLWQKLFGDNAVVINDDKPAVRMIDGAFYAFGTPFCGKDDINTNLGAPVAGICFLQRGQENSITPAPVAETLPLLLAQTHMPKYIENLDMLLSLVDRLVCSVPMFKMACNMSVDAARVAYKGMGGERL